MGASLQPSLTHASLFSGIGGFDYAAELAGWINLFNCEIDPFCQSVLNYHFPYAKQYTDIKTIDFTKWEGKVDVLSGGFPCQPFSQAGKRKGTKDNRYLWPEMLRAIQQISPRWIVGENVLGIVNWNEGLVFEQICSDLETENYQVQPFILPACGINAPHRRYRTFFIAYRTDTGTQGVQQRRFDCFHRFIQTASTDPNFNLHQRTQRGGDSQKDSLSPINWETNSTTGQSCRADQCDNGRSISNTSATHAYNARGRSPESNTDNQRTQSSQEWKQSLAGVSGYGYFQSSTNTIGSCSKEWVDRQSDEYCQLFQFDWFPTQSPVCGRDDGVSAILDSDTLYKGAKTRGRHPFAKWRTESIKGYGNAVVPPLILQIFNAINQYEEMIWENTEN